MLWVPAKKWVPPLLLLPPSLPHASAVSGGGLTEVSRSPPGVRPSPAARAMSRHVSQVDIGPATQLQLKPLKEGYVIPDISVLLSREIFQLGDDPALCAKVAAAIESFTLRQYGLPNDEQEIFLATNRRTGELVGCVFLKRLKTKDLPGYDVLDAADIPLMESLAVNPKYSGQGIGSRLVKECENLALKWGYNKLLLQVCGRRGAVAAGRAAGYGGFPLGGEKEVQMCLSGSG